MIIRLLICTWLVFLAYDLGRMVGQNQIKRRINDKHRELTKIVMGLTERAEREKILSKEEATKIKNNIIKIEKI